jgi:hypothetical protein
MTCISLNPVFDFVNDVSNASHSHLPKSSTQSLLEIGWKEGKNNQMP